MIIYNSKDSQSVTLCGQPMTLEYFQRVQAPLLIQALGWSVETLVNWCESAEIPLGQFARVPKVQTYLTNRAAAQEQARKDAEEAEQRRRAMFPTAEERKADAEQARQLHQARLKQAAEIRKGRFTKPAQDTNFSGGGITSNGDWD